MQVRPTRSCAQKSCVYVEFFFTSDDEGSDFGEETSTSNSDCSDEDYDPATSESPAFDKKKGEDNWVGRRVVKTFGEHGDFDGIVFAVDDDANKPGYRPFVCSALL